MKKIHYLNIGMAKAGTTAMFDTLSAHPEVDFDGEKENYLYSHHGYTAEQYAEYYKKFNVSLNFCPGLWTMESRQIIKLSLFVTHYSIIFRNPFDFVKSLYNFLPHDNHNINLFVDMMLETNQLDYSKILEHWDLITQTKLFKILYYDDLINDKNFYNSILDFLGLDRIELVPQISNVTKTKRNSGEMSIEHIKTINHLVEKFEQRVNKDLSHWKKNV